MKQLTAISRLRAVPALLALLVLASSLLAGCGGAAGSGSAPDADSAPQATNTPNPDDADYDAAAGLIDKEVFGGTVLEETKDAGRAYLDETLFLGDSNTYRYMMYADESGQAFSGLDNTIGVVSMGAGAIPTLKCMQFKGQSGPVTMPQAVTIMQPRRIIICFGTNNLGGGTDSFIKSYKDGLAAIHKAYEYADIIVSAVPPLDQQRENGSLSMKQVDAFNAAIAEMCKEEGYKFLDTSEALKDPKTGWARKDYTLGDGVHLSKDGVTALFEYIRTHAYITEDTRPKPLKPVPKAEGVPPGLISQDPIAVRGARVPVEFVAGEGGSIQGEVSQKIKKGQSCSTVTAVPDEGWEFDYWTVSYGSAGGSPTLTFVVPGDADANGIVITAHFKRAHHDHDWQETERVEPSCYQKGTIRYKCKWCDERKEESIPATGEHLYDKTGKCTTEGCTAIRCPICGSKEHTHTEKKPCPNQCPVCGKSSLDGHTHVTACEICGATSHTTGGHPKCDFCGATDHTTENHPQPTCGICGLTGHTTETHPADPPPAETQDPPPETQTPPSENPDPPPETPETPSDEGTPDA